MIYLKKCELKEGHVYITLYYFSNSDNSTITDSSSH